ncbi:MAG TPA: hypothetical protein VM578_03050 [Candidatus Saccharimonadales bacterium]|nr:hypothetical protein [Candidatus Saccharimonadales bacterium]
MRRIGWMFLVVLGSAGLLLSQSSTNAMHSENPMKMSGTVCSSSCVTQVGSSMTPTCDTSCTNKSGDAVLVDDQGNVHKIANQDMCKSHMGKHVKMTAAPMPPTEKQREESLRIMELYDDPGGGF